MIEGRPSRTAERVALRRAAHQLVDVPVVHRDPVALAILDAAEAAALRENSRLHDNTPIAPFLRAHLAVRSRVAEDTLATAVAAGVRQYVVLGAGLDTFAYRNPFAELRVFEVDHPTTQAWKRERLASGGIAVPASVTFVGIDFAVEPLPHALARAGWRSDEPSFFSWLGVTPYLEPATVLAVLGAIAPFTRGGGGVVFDYGVPPESLPQPQRIAYEAMAAWVAAAGEPLRGHFEPAALMEAVRGLGFQRVRDIAGDELNAIYFSDRTDGLRVGSAGHILIAHG